MKHVRWYDKNPDLKDVFEFIENLDEQRQGDIAKDILQILVNDFNFDLDEKINNISKNYTYKCKRWYDTNIDLHTSFEIIKDVPEDVQCQIVRKIIQTVLLIYFESGGNE
ncbi:MAG TPA: hypothetical protein PLG15_01120 [Candidatus Gastranaerophilaceae bacterium]|nr:hypothetical protein [Candidatus Gastranaerophilaceae bacterium]HPT40968.1 hypothetical protein [Candidatus Gastranaerophilaceae bacterium]